MTTAADDTVPHYPESDAFWAGLEQGELLLPHCDACSTTFFPPAPGCPRCGRPDQIGTSTATGEGMIYSWIEVHYPFEPEFADEVPYIVAEVALAEGPRVYARAVGISAEEIEADLAVRIGTGTRDGRPYLTCGPNSAAAASVDG